MSEQEHERPLTRRELRLREQAEREGVESIDDLVASDEPTPSDEAPAAADDVAAVAGIEVEIDPLHPDGTPRTRREMRELRAAAIAEIVAEREGDTEGEQGTAAADEDDSYGAPTEALSFEDLPSAEDAAEDELELDAPTEAFTLEDILDAAEPKSPTGDAEAVANLFAADDTDSVEVVEIIDDVEVSGEPTVVADVVEVDVADVEPAEVVEGEAVEAEAVATDEVADAVVVEETLVEEAVAEQPAPEENDDESVDTSTDTAGYSFPDIQPPEEWRSVFDDPSRAATITAPGESGDFDDLISRAVAQEGSTGGTGASALILPTHPGDTGGLTGPLGSTGELFVTGSIELPKSMGETGGHSGIHDSLDYDPFLTGENPESSRLPVSPGRCRCRRSAQSAHVAAQRFPLSRSRRRIAARCR
ncbi:hypothetical protein [Leucobacter sp. G161]|uniref:hypothetical protein n=1 Tax=Leucobacter sp. G161 TaxID=663704 RepID=UPI00073B6089|nr:hypothetical protein [Leucobacter sp. G161]KUF06664.1 hypothetical protein AUL38_11590 [Leucobacter sp. G161]